MNKYLLTSPRTEGSITFGFNLDESLVLFEVAMPTLTSKQLDWFHSCLPAFVSITKFLTWAKEWKFKAVQLQEDLSFERFWNEYDKKRDRLEAEKEWTKLTDEEKQLVFSSLVGYRRYMKREPWYNQLYAKTYLQQKQWTSEWDKC